MRGLSIFLLRGVVTFLFLEIALLPLRTPLSNLLQSFLPPNFYSTWECTGIDEVLLYLSFIWAFPSKRSKIPLYLAGTLLIEAYNALRIFILIHFPSHLLHEVLFRWIAYVYILLLLYFSFRYLAGQR